MQPIGADDDKVDVAAAAAALPTVVEAADAQHVSRTSSDKADHGGEAGTIDESTVIAEGEEKSSLFLIFLTLAAAGSGLLFGAFDFQFPKHGRLK